MAPTMKSLGIEQLSMEQKLTLIEELWDSIAAEAESMPIPASHWQELERRIALRGTEPTQTWEEVCKELESEL